MRYMSREYRRALERMVGRRVRATASGWLGTIVRVIPGNSSPLRVRWDRNGTECQTNFMVVELAYPEGVEPNGDNPNRESQLI